MEHLDLQVIKQAISWTNERQPIWLCTVLSSFGSSPREAGSWLVADAQGRHVGSLSGGCVEEDFLTRLREGMFQERVSRIRYGAPDGPSSPQVVLPCGGILDVLIEKLPTDQHTTFHLERLKGALTGDRPVLRTVKLPEGNFTTYDDSSLGPRVHESTDQRNITFRIGPVARLIIAGISPVSEACASFAKTLGFEVIVCDPRRDKLTDFAVSGVTKIPTLPSMFIANEGCHSATAVVALTHDPRIDDLALMEAVKTPAFYIGVMGSHQTSQSRAARLHRSGGLSQTDIERIHMPIGLALGSKTPSEIAIAVMADIVRIRRGKARHVL